MKRFLKIFIFLQTLILSFLFVTSVFNIYEKNTIINTNHIAYQLNDNSASNRGKLYDELVTSDISFEFIKNDLKSKEITYNVFKSPNSPQKEYSILASDTKISYSLTNKQDFQDSSGIFYTIPDFNIHENPDLSVMKVNENTIDYSQILMVNGINLIILILFTLIVYFIFTSTELKKITLKKMMGFSNWRICKNYLCRISWLQILFFLVEIGIFTLYAMHEHANWVMLSLILLGCSFIAVIINCLLMALSQLLILRIDISRMLKNSNFNKMISRILIPAKFFFIIALSFSFYYLTTTLNNINDIKNKMTSYSSFANHYTSDGFNSDIYEKVLSNAYERNEFSKNTKNLYTNENNVYLIDDSFLQKDEESNYLLINQNSFNSLIKDRVTSSTLSTDSKTIYILIPKDSEVNKEKIENDLEEDLTVNLPNYDTYFGEANQPNVTDIKTKYLSYTGDLTLEYYSSGKQEFTEIKKPILIVDNGAFSGLFYTDLLNTKSIYFIANSLSDFDKLLVDYKLNDIVIPGNVLTPFEKEIENYKFTLNNISFFLVIFIITTIFIIIFSNKIKILADRKKYAIQDLLGFSFFKVFRAYIICSSILIIGMLVLSLVEYMFLLSAILLLFDLFVLYWQYVQLVKRNINNSLKGE